MYNKQTITSRPGLSQEEALISLQAHPEFQRRQAKIGGIRRRGDVWVATILEPKTAEFPPVEEEAPKEEAPDAEADDGGEGGPPSDEGGEDSGDGGPPKPEGEKGKEKGGEKAEISSLLHLVEQIADALGIVPPDAMGAMGPAGPDDMGPGPGGPPAPPPHGGPAPGAGGPPGPPGAGGAPGGHKLRPGEVPNKPGVVPVGSPAFASTRSFTASTKDLDGTVKVADAKRDLETQFPGCKVAQIKRDGDTIRALLTR